MCFFFFSRSARTLAFAFQAVGAPPRHRFRLLWNSEKEIIVSGISRRRRRRLHVDWARRTLPYMHQSGSGDVDRHSRRPLPSSAHLGWSLVAHYDAQERMTVPTDCQSFIVTAGIRSPPSPDTFVHRVPSNGVIDSQSECLSVCRNSVSVTLTSRTVIRRHVLVVISGPPYIVRSPRCLRAQIGRSPIRF